MVVINGSIGSPRFPASIRMIVHRLGDQQRRQNIRPSGAIESASSFDEANEIEAKTKI